MSVYPVALTLAAAGVAATWYSQGRSRKSYVTGDEVHTSASGKTVSVDDKSFFSSPEPDRALTLETLPNRAIRDHLYANKTVRYPYFQTMAHQPMQPEHWIELDNEYAWYLAERKRVIQEQGKVVIDCLPEAEHACMELMIHVVEYLPVRYPGLFETIRDETGITGIWSKVIDERLMLYHEKDGKRVYKSGVDALHVVARLTQDDYLIGMPREDGHWYFVGGLVSFPGFYLLSSKIGLSLHQTHEPVPQFNEKLLPSVERTLHRLTPSTPFERSSWEFVDDRNLFWHPMAGPIPTHTGAKATTERMRLGRDDPEHGTKSDGPENLWFRIDHQTFVKMPESGAVMFGVHPVLRKVSEMENNPLVPALLTKVHLESSPDLIKYKAADHYLPELLPYLAELTQRQIDKGLITGEERVQDFRELVGKAKATTVGGK